MAEPERAHSASASQSLHHMHSHLRAAQYNHSVLLVVTEQLCCRFSNLIRGIMTTHTGAFIQRQANIQFLQTYRLQQHIVTWSLVSSSDKKQPQIIHYADLYNIFHDSLRCCQSGHMNFA